VVFLKTRGQKWVAEEAFEHHSRKEKVVSGALAGEPLKKEPLKAKFKSNPFIISVSVSV
jgi:hypothetical protein